MFLDDIGNHPVLSREGEYGLAVMYKEKRDIEAAKKLVVSNLRFVVKVASEYISYGFPLLDLIQEGAIGLMEAVKKFNPYKGYRLISYAVWWVRAKIQSFIMKSWSLVKIGTTQAQRKLFQKIGRSKKQLGITDNDPSDEDLKKVADLFGVKERDVLGMEIRTASRDFSLDSVSTDDGSLTYLDLIPDTGANQEEIMESIETNELTHDAIRRGLAGLSERERYVVEKRYLKTPPAKLRELGDELRISKERVRQIEAEALEKLHAVIENRLNLGYALENV